MKRKLWFFLFIASLTSFSCKKSSDSTPLVATSKWTFNGVTYKVTDAWYESSSSYLEASDDPGVVGGGNFVRVVFGAFTKPAASTSLTVVQDGLQSDPSNCGIEVGDYYGATYYSTGKAGDKVTLSVSSSGKLTTSFSNITISADGGTTTKTVSGNLIEQ